MKLKELIKKFTFKEVLERIKREYPDQKIHAQSYKGVYDKLIKCRNTKKSKLTIVVDKVTKDYDGSVLEEPWTDIHALSANGKKIYDNDRVDEEGNCLESYAIEMTPWREWLEMEIHERSFKDYDELSIVAHCLWEMTFCGYEEVEIKDKVIDLKKRCDDIDKWEKEGTLDKHTVPWEEVKEKLDLKIKEMKEKKDGKNDKGSAD